MNKVSLVAMFLLGMYSGASCAALNHEPLSGEAYRLTDQAYQSLARHDDAMAESLVMQARAAQPDSYQLAMLLLDIQMRRGEWQAAQQLSASLLTALPNDALLLANSGFIAAQNNQIAQAQKYFQAALQQPGLDATQQSNVQNALNNLTVADAPKPVAAKPAEDPLSAAYRYINEHNDAQALAKFQEAFALKPGTAGQYADAAYTAKHLGQNQVAMDLLQKAIDANAALPADKQPFTAQQAFTYRREIQQMNRSWGAVTSLSYQHNGLTSSSKLNTLQGGVEAYWQPNDFAGNRDGHLFQAFAGASETLYDAQGGKTGSPTAQATLGVRYKPFSTLGMIVVAQQIIPIGASINADTLLQAAYSDAAGSELNVQDEHWRNWQYFADAAYFVRARRSYNTFEGTYGEAFHWQSANDRVLLIPHWVLAVENDSAATKATAVSTGPGVKLRYYLREDAHNAPASWLEFNLQYRFEMTNVGRLGGMLMRAIYWY